MSVDRPIFAAIAIAVAGLLAFSGQQLTLTSAGVQSSAQTLAAPTVGAFLPEGGYHPISNPGVYGLGPTREGNQYAIESGKIIRIEVKSRKILSILREQHEILD